MVVMVYLSGWVMLGETPREKRLQYKGKLDAALRVIHDRDLVHSDVRCPNILVSEDNINFVGFDHYGKGVKRYPREWDHTQQREDAKEGDLMLRPHDDWILERIIDRSYSFCNDMYCNCGLWCGSP